MGCILRPGKKEWSGGVLPYNIRTSDFNARSIDAINAAIKYWNATTNWQIKPRTKEKDYVIFRRGAGCSSQIGRQGGSQGINLDAGCTTGSVIHEIGHAVGFAHEQNRSDRDNYVAVIESRIDPNFIHNFRKVQSSEYRDVGDYDHRSLMHYGRSSFLRDKKYDWQSWYDNVEIIKAPGNPSLFLLKSGTGEAHNLCLNANFIAHEKSRHQWTTNWTSSKFYSVGNRHFLFLLKASDGTVHINEVSGVGDIGRNIKSYNWTAGWTNVDLYQVFNKTYLLLYKFSSGQCHIHEMKSDGTVGPRVSNTSLGAGVSFVKTYDVGNKVYLYRMKKSTGNVQLNVMSPAGTLSVSVGTYGWSSGWDVQEFYTIGSQTYLFSLKSSNGNVIVYRINPDGRIGGIIQRLDWNSRWTHARVYWSDGRIYLYLHKVHSGEAQIRSITTSGRIGARTKMNPGVTLLATQAIGGRGVMTPTDIISANARI